MATAPILLILFLDKSSHVRVELEGLSYGYCSASLIQKISCFRVEL